MCLAQVEEENGRFAHFELVSCKCVDTYVRVKKNQNQICWKWTKVRPCTRKLQLRRMLHGAGMH